MLVKVLITSAIWANNPKLFLELLLDYILQLNNRYHSYMTNKMLLKVDFPYDDDDDNNKHDIEKVPIEK